MTIRYTNGYTQNAILLTRTDASLRLAIPGSDDILELTQVNGRWTSEDCELIQVEFARGESADPASVAVEDCICSHELAAHLLHLLFSGENEAEAETVSFTGISAPVHHQVI